MPQPVWSAVPTSSTEACRDSSIPSDIGWMFLSKSCTNSARHHGVQLPAWPSASVPRGIVPISRRCRITATSSIRHPTAPSRTASPAQLLCPMGFPCVWSVSLEFLPDSLQNPIIGGNSFRQSLKTFLFATYWCIQRIRGFTTMCYINRLFTYLLT